MNGNVVHELFVGLTAAGSIERKIRIHIHTYSLSWRSNEKVMYFRCELGSFPGKFGGIYHSMVEMYYLRIQS